MEKRDCIHMEDIVDTYTRQDSFGNPYQECELVDEVCNGRPNSPLHHNEYDCEKCPYYKTKE